MFNLFGGSKNTIKAPKILICAIGGDGENAALLAQDRAIYQPHYTNVTEFNADSARLFFDYLDDKTFGDRTFDVVHLLADVDPEGNIGGKPGIQMLEYLSKVDAKLVLFASDNPADNYFKAFPNDRPKRLRNMNLVLTLDRKCDNFSNFFKALFDLMAKGKSMPMAWVQLVPQAGGPWQEQMPDTFFLADRGHIKLIP